METIIKINVEKLKSDIKELAEKQKFYRNQRKTEKIIGERKLQPWEAACAHRENRNKLRIMYAAYGTIKGKKFSEIENYYSEENHPLKEYQYQIDKLIKKYEIHE